MNGDFSYLSFIQHKDLCLFGINLLFPNKNLETIQRTVMGRKTRKL